MKGKFFLFSAMICLAAAVLLGGCGHDKDKDFSTLQTPESQEDADQAVCREQFCIIFIATAVYQMMKKSIESDVAKVV